MGLKTAIEWTEATWNPVTGCSKVSAGCKNCYAERMATRLHAMGSPNYRNGFQPTVHEHTLDLPLTWKRPQAVFVNSMSDLFHRAVPLSFILKVFAVMRQAHWHYGAQQDGAGSARIDGASGRAGGGEILPSKGARAMALDAVAPNKNPRPTFSTHPCRSGRTRTFTIASAS